MKSRLFVAGMLFTLAWLTLMGTLVILRWPETGSLKLNELGDFFAGFFAPIAFLWLVLGFLQQGKELQLSTKALELQAEELHRSVEQQRQLVEVTRLQVESEMEALSLERKSRQEAARPRFVVGGVGAQFSGTSSTYRASIKNVGNTATDLEVTLQSPELGNQSLGMLPSFSRGDEFKVTIHYNDRPPEFPSTILITYIDAENLPGEARYKVMPVVGGPNVMLRIDRE